MSLAVRNFRSACELAVVVWTSSARRLLEIKFAYLLREGECFDPEIVLSDTLEPDVRCTLWCFSHCEAFSDIHSFSTER